MRRLLPLLLIVAAACKSAAPPAAPPRPQFGEHGFDLAGLDRTIAPCDDFYQFATGGWRAANPLPAAYSRFGRFEELADRNRETLRAILEQSTSPKLRDFWDSCMDEAAIEAHGIAPIAPELARIDAIASQRDLQDALTRLHQRGLTPLFRFNAQNDFRSSRQIIAAVSQAGLGLPDRDYYLRDDERFRTTREQYVKHIAKLFELAGWPAARASTNARRVLALERRLADASMPRVEQRNPENVYHVTPIAELQQLAPNLDWPRYFAAIGAADLQSLNVAQPKFFAAAGDLLAQIPLDDWKAYLRWTLLDAAAPMLSSPFVQADFEFRGRILSGQQAVEERWKRCVNAADASLGQLLGQEYVRRTFTPEAKRKMNELIDNIVAAFAFRIPDLHWMNLDTKRVALEKVNRVVRRIGYPEKWIDDSPLTIGRGSHAENTFAARAFAFRRNASRVGKPDDPDEWGLFTPSTVNASYSPTRNDITFPAAILQPPFYDPNADDAYNYGGIGTAIGHEITHGFDDLGAKFDAEGNLRNWWTPDELRNFRGRTACLFEQYQKHGMNARLVIGEASADLGGVAIAFGAYQRSLEGKERKIIDGFTPEQRFFLGFAQVWGENMAAEEQARRAVIDAHAPAAFRVNLTVANLPDFQHAFACPADAKMARGPMTRCLGPW